MILKRPCCSQSPKGDATRGTLLSNHKFSEPFRSDRQAGSRESVRQNFASNSRTLLTGLRSEFEEVHSPPNSRRFRHDHSYGRRDAPSGDPGRTIQPSTRHLIGHQPYRQRLLIRLQYGRQINEFRQHSVRAFQRHHRRNGQPLRSLPLPTLGPVAGNRLPRIPTPSEAIQLSRVGGWGMVPFHLHHHMPITNQHIIAATRLRPP